MNLKNKKIMFVAAGSVIVGMMVSIMSNPSPAYSNSAPTVDSITIALSSGGSAVSSIDVTEAGTKTLYIHGSASDVDGCTQIDSVDGSSQWQVVFYRSEVQGIWGCTANNRDCYQIQEQQENLSGCSGPLDVNLNFEMSFPLYYYADATDTGSSPNYASQNWTATVVINDDQFAQGSSSMTTEISTLKALNVTSSIGYGSIQLGQTSAEKTIVITNTGNDNDLDPAVEDADGWACTYGSFAGSQVHWNTVAEQGWGSGTAVNSVATDMNDLSITKSATNATSTKNVYVTLKIPNAGFGGSCSSTLRFTAQ